MPKSDLILCVVNVLTKADVKAICQSVNAPSSILTRKTLEICHMTCIMNCIAVTVSTILATNLDNRLSVDDPLIPIESRVRWSLAHT